MNRPLTVIVLASLVSLPSVDAEEPTTARVLLGEGPGSGHRIEVAARVGQRVVVVGQKGRSEIEVIVRKLPPEKRAIVYVEVRPTQESDEMTLPMGLPLGRWFRLVNVNSGHCLAVAEGALTPESKLVQAETVPFAQAKVWRLVPTCDRGWFALQNRASEQVVSLPGRRKNAGANVVQTPMEKGNVDQQWRLVWVENDVFVVLNRHSGQTLAVAYGAKHPGATICQWPLHVDWRQHQWRFEVVDRK
jgi:hypothetical protein